jgi:hypothetical protein
MKIIKGDLVLKENTTIDDGVKVEGNIRCEGGFWDLNCRDLSCWDLDCLDLDCLDLNCLDLNCWNLDCLDLNCWNLDCLDLKFNAVAIAYHSFKCKSWKARRGNYIIKCLDGEIEIKDDKKYCDKCGSDLKC